MDTHEGENIDIEDLLGPDRTLTDREFYRCRVTFPGPLLVGDGESDDPKAWRVLRCVIRGCDITAAPGFVGTFIIAKNTDNIRVSGSRFIGSGATP